MQLLIIAEHATQNQPWSIHSFWSFQTTSYNFTQERSFIMDESKAKGELSKIHQDVISAAISGDLAALNNLISDDFTATISNGQRKKKTDFAGHFRSGDVKFESIKVEDSNVRVHGNTAIVTGLATVKGHNKTSKNKGANNTGEFGPHKERFIAVLVNDNNSWRAVEIQSTRIK
jgi:ketosteroid isomerase-like protein